MCGADLSDIDGEMACKMQGNSRKNTCPNKEPGNEQKSKEKKP
jgi:hypothetical protein